MARAIVDATDAINYLNKVSIKQLPFATAKSLNDVAFSANREVSRDMSKTFIIRRPFVQKGLRVDKAKKKNLTATVFHRDAYMDKQQVGGTLRGVLHRISVPAMIRTNIRKRIPKSKRPSTILKKPKVRLGPYGILERTTKGKGYKVLYRLKRKVKIKPIWDYGKQVQEHVDANYTKIFNKNLLNALKTAK